MIGLFVTSTGVGFGLMFNGSMLNSEKAKMYITFWCFASQQKRHDIALLCCKCH